MIEIEWEAKRQWYLGAVRRLQAQADAVFRRGCNLYRAARLRPMPDADGGDQRDDPPEEGAAMTDEPISPTYVDQMRALAESLDKFLNQGKVKRTGFVLLLFPFDAVDLPEGEHRCNYISNARRDQVTKMLREQLAYFERGTDKPRGTVQ